MLAIRGIYTGHDIRLLEDVRIRPNIRVIVTFLEDEQPLFEQESSSNVSSATREFLQKCGGWEDSRSADDIVAEIYAARTSSTRGAEIFQENA